MNKYCLIFFSFILLASCHKKDAEVPAVDGADYFPADIGSYRTYDVHQTFYNGIVTDTTYQVKEVINDKVDFVGGSTYELYRYYRTSNSKPWPFQPDSVWRMTKNTYQVTVEQGSVEFIFLVFPFSENLQWNGNGKNVFGEDIFTLKDIGKPYTYNTKTFSTTCNVEEARVLNLVEKDYRNRIYAKDIGLIYKKYETLRYKDDPASIGSYIIDYGTITEQKLIDYGNP